MRLRGAPGRTLMIAALMAVTILCAAADEGALGEEKVGVRPYELDWAGRTKDDHPPLVDFEDQEGWIVETRNSEATFVRSREQQIWGRYVGKLTYRGTGPGPNEVRIRPPSPIPIREPFDAVTLWCYGNNWGYAPDPRTPQVGISALFRDASGAEFGVYLYHVDWTEWYLLHRRLTPEQIERVRGGASFTGLLITGGRQPEDRTLYFDNLAVYTEEFPPLTFAPRPERGVAMFPGQGVGTNTGPGKLPFPTREQTILPPVLDRQAKVSASRQGAGVRFVCTDRTGSVEYVYTPETGRWDDIQATFRPAAGGGSVRFRPCVGGGVWLATGEGARAPENAEMLAADLEGEVFTARWKLSVGDAAAEVTYRFRIWGKSLVMDVLAPGGHVAEVRYGAAQGVQNPRLVTHPFYPAEGGRPATLVFDGPAGPLFIMGNTDWYRTNASIMWATPAIHGDEAFYNGGTRYVPLTNGKRNDCFERFFLTLSPIFEETLPVVDNPVSPWKKITGTHVWRAHGAGNREADKRYWAEVKRHGMTKVVVTDHETMWRDGGESFTFRTKAAPGKGGDEGARDYSRYMQDVLGFVYGPYNNFTDFAPVNEYWSTDMVARDPQNQLQHAWMRCYAPKPARAVEFCEKLSPINQAKFGFSTAYCDVHTAVAPWHRVDYDPRVPGAGTMAAVFYSYGEIMLLQKAAWNGPVYSEGNYHAFYCGLTDGNYGQDQAYRPAENPWLVDFDLRRLHDLGCNFGMGNPDMFYANVPQPRSTREERDAWLDRFLAATAAFGHPGFLVMEGGMASGMKSYFMLQQLHSRYCLASATDIRYVDEQGRLLTSSQAVASGAYRRSQVVVRYSDGTVVAANGHRKERMRTTAFGRKLDLPPNGYCGWTADGAIEVTNWHPSGRYADCAKTPEYIFVDGRGRFVRFPWAASAGLAVCRKVRQGEWEIIPLENVECGFAMRAKSAIALDKEGKPMGPAEIRTARGLLWVMPVQGAFSYLLRDAAPLPAARPADTSARRAPAATPELQCRRDLVTPGETVTVQGRQTHRVRIPPDARPGTHIWRRLEGRWIDFTVTEAFAAAVRLDGHDLVVTVTSRLPAAEPVRIFAAGKTASVQAVPGAAVAARIPLGAPRQESAQMLRVGIRGKVAAMTLEMGLEAVLGHVPLAAFPEKFTAGVGLRGMKDTPGFGDTGANAAWERMECGGQPKQGLAMHPPWLNNTLGTVYALFDPVALPDTPAAFRAQVGKRDGSDPGDGILYRVLVVDRTGFETVVAERMVKRHGWEPIDADLSQWAGQTVRLKLVADPGPDDDTSGDWAAWADMRIETLEPALRWRLEADGERFRRAQGPCPVRGLTIRDLRSARRGWLHYEGKGMDGGQYAKEGILNGVWLGMLPSASGSEGVGAFSEPVSMELPREAIESLGMRNRFVLKNPGRDYFSIRRLWLEIELADGRRCSSWIADVTFTQPPEWQYAEGIPVPFERDIEADIWFDAAPEG